MFLRADHMAADAEHIRRRRFRRIDVDQLEPVEVTRIDPVAVDQQRRRRACLAEALACAFSDARAKAGYRRFQMQTPRHGHGDDLVARCRDVRRELAGAFGVGPSRNADEDATWRDEYVAAVQRSWWLDELHAPVWRERRHHVG